MTVAGIICEYNPFHYGHERHMRKTRESIAELSGEDCAIVCAMSGNYVQRGDFAVFGKFTRAEAAVRCGADLVVEIPSAYALLSAEGFAAAGVHILESIGVCSQLSFGSEAGEIAGLMAVAEVLAKPEAGALIREYSDLGLSYAVAAQKAVDRLAGEAAELLKSPNNLLGIEYIKAIAAQSSKMRPITVERYGVAHDSGSGRGSSASGLRSRLASGHMPMVIKNQRGSTNNSNGTTRMVPPWIDMPYRASFVFIDEIKIRRGPVFMAQYEQAMLSRLRSLDDFSALPGLSEGIERRFASFAAKEPTIDGLLRSVKTKRYAMSRVRRLLMCACLGMTVDDTLEPPPYIRVLAMNEIGMALLREAKDKAKLPIITKAATVKALGGRAAALFSKEAAATDFYVLAYEDVEKRVGGQEWRETPRIIDSEENKSF
ncbi:MAG: nucleotidyltransferase family protein [Oscillospiraceae bacterium]|nr:nucleotidyltransferase family protein [Oscillospiraceae bacterium]